MANSMKLVVTNAGRDALKNATGNGTNALTIESVVLGNGRYTPDPGQSWIREEHHRLKTIAGAVTGSQSLHVTVRDESRDRYSVFEIGLVTNTGVLFAVYSQNDVIIEKATGSTLLLSLDIELTDIDVKQIAFGDTNFINPPATLEMRGVIEIADVNETVAGVDEKRAVVPAYLKKTLDVRFGKLGSASEYDEGYFERQGAAKAVKDALGEAAGWGVQNTQDVYKLKYGTGQLLAEQSAAALRDALLSVVGKVKDGLGKASSWGVQGTTDVYALSYGTGSVLSEQSAAALRDELLSVVSKVEAGLGKASSWGVTDTSDVYTLKYGTGNLSSEQALAALRDFLIKSINDVEALLKNAAYCDVAWSKDIWKFKYDSGLVLSEQSGAALRDTLNALIINLDNSLSKIAKTGNIYDAIGSLDYSRISNAPKLGDAASYAVNKTNSLSYNYGALPTEGTIKAQFDSLGHAASWGVKEDWNYEKAEFGTGLLAREGSIAALRDALRSTDATLGFAFAKYRGKGSIGRGGVVPGVDLIPASAEYSFDSEPLSGQWKCLGACRGADTNIHSQQATLWVRIS